MTYGNLNVDTVTTSTAGGVLGAGNASLMKNRIINGACVIDQRNAGAAITNAASGSGYPVDRFNSDNGTDGAYTAQQVSDAPAGFNYSVKITVTTADASLAAGQYSNFFQSIEGYNLADLNWGTANAKTITLSFWVKSSLTGTFGGALRGASSTRSYPFTYTISSANTWEQKSVTIVGCPDGTWLTTNGTGVQVFFGLGVGSTFSGTAGAWASASYRSATGATNILGTLSATWQVTGIQLEVGSSATGFEYRQYQQELALCQRYYYKLVAGGTASSPFGSGFNLSTTLAVGVTSFPVTMRIAPTSLEQSGTAGQYRVRRTADSVVCSDVPAFFSATPNSGASQFTVASGLTAGQGSLCTNVTADTGYLAWSAEL